MKPASPTSCTPSSRWRTGASPPTDTWTGPYRQHHPSAGVRRLTFAGTAIGLLVRLPGGSTGPTFPHMPAGEEAWCAFHGSGRAAAPTCRPRRRPVQVIEWAAEIRVSPLKTDATCRDGGAGDGNRARVTSLEGASRPVCETSSSATRAAHGGSSMAVVDTWATLLSRC